MGEDEPGYRSCSEHIPIELWSRRSRRRKIPLDCEIPDAGAWQFQGYDENGLLRSLSGRLTGVNKVLCGAAEIACKEQQDFYLGQDGGNMIPIHSKIGQGMRTHFEKLVSWHGKNELIPVYLENNIFNFYLNREVKSTETNNVHDADHCLAKICHQLGNGDCRAVRS